MKVLARIFSALTLLAILFGGAVIYLSSRPPLKPIEPAKIVAIDRILVEKAARRMTLFYKDKAVASLRVSLGASPIGDKVRQGDGRTPEGVYHINRKNDASAFHLSLGLDYPQAEDLARAKAGGYDAGGDIMIHGQPNAMPDAVVIPSDWTAGCIAVSNAEIRQIFAATPIGTEVVVTP